MDQKARVVNRVGVYLLLKVVLHEIKNILQHFHRLHGLRHVVALALAVYQMKGDIPGFLLRQFDPVLLANNRHRLAGDAELLRIKTPDFRQQAILNGDPFTAALDGKGQVVGEGKENLLANLAGELQIGAGNNHRRHFDDLIRNGGERLKIAAARAERLGHEQLLYLLRGDLVPGSAIETNAFPHDDNLPVIVVHREHEAIIEHLLNNHLCDSSWLPFCAMTSLYHQKLRLRILCRRFRSSSPRST